MGLKSLARLAWFPYNHLPIALCDTNEGMSGNRRGQSAAGPYTNRTHTRRFP